MKSVTTNTDGERWENEFPDPDPSHVCIPTIFAPYRMPNNGFTIEPASPSRISFSVYTNPKHGLVIMDDQGVTMFEGTTEGFAEILNAAKAK